MTQYLGIITAYGAVAILAWLAALLYPRLVPQADGYVMRSRWREAGLLGLALLAAIALGEVSRRGYLLTGKSSLAAIFNMVVIYVPLLAYIVFRRSRAALFFPPRNILRSLLIGLCFGVLAILAYYLTTSAWGELPAVLQGMAFGSSAEILVRALLRTLVVGAFLALVSNGWSNKVALALAGIAITLTQVPGLLESGFTGAWLGMLLVHLAIVIGLISALLVTRNIVWFWPVFAALNLLQFYSG